MQTGTRLNWCKLRPVASGGWGCLGVTHLDFRPNCKSCLYLSMVLQRPVGCEQHAGTSAWSAAAPAARQRPEASSALPSGPLALPSEVDRADADASPNPDVAALFSRAEYQRLCALRARVQAQLDRGRRPDDADPAV